MKVRELLNDWSSHSYDKNSMVTLSIDLPIKQVAHIRALAEMFPGRSDDLIITDLLAVALDELQAGIPYIKGSKVITEDEFGDPVYEDIGMTPRFLELSQKHQQLIRAQLAETVE